MTLAHGRDALRQASRVMAKVSTSKYKKDAIPRDGLKGLFGKCDPE